MRALIQRVTEARVDIGGITKGKINRGLLVLLGIENEDDHNDIEWLCGKIARLRIFNDEKGVMNYSVGDVKGGVLLISQFTLHASTKKGNRPSYIRAAGPDKAIPLYEAFIARLNMELDSTIETGEFGANMQVQLVNDGPVTIMVDSRNRE